MKRLSAKELLNIYITGSGEPIPCSVFLAANVVKSLEKANHGAMRAFTLAFWERNELGKVVAEFTSDLPSPFLTNPAYVPNCISTVPGLGISMDTVRHSVKTFLSSARVWVPLDGFGDEANGVLLIRSSELDWLQRHMGWSRQQ